jgi:hypothetical protein
MVKRKCPKCDAIFDRKSNYEAHINKKFDCSYKKNNHNDDQNNNQNDEQNIYEKMLEFVKNFKKFYALEKNVSNINLTNSLQINNVINDIDDDNTNDDNTNDDNTNNNITNNNITNNDNDLYCFYCKKKFSSKYTLSKHMNFVCKIKKENDNKKENNNKNINFIKLLSEKNNENNENKQKIIKLEEQNKLLLDKIDKNKLLVDKIDKINNCIIKNNDVMKIHKTIKKLETSIPANTNLNISNQYLEQILNKDKLIEKLSKVSSDIIIQKNSISQKLEIELETELETELEKLFEEKKLDTELMTLNLNENIIECRKSDGYINATQLCKAGCKDFLHWINLETTKEIIDELANETGILASLLVDINKITNKCIFIHSDLAIQLAQWISPKFALKLNYWIKSLFTQGKVGVDIKILKEKENIINDYKKRVEHLEKAILKKHPRKKLDDNINIVYLITCEELEAKRKYIIGKAENMINRLSQYNKISNFKIVYSISFDNENDMMLAEKIVLNRLEKFKEQMNHDRFILPVDKNISFFKDVFDNVLKFMYIN